MLSSEVSRRLARLVRYGMVSMVATATSLTVLAALVATRSMQAAPANVAATLVGMMPSFELNRRWVWDGGGGPSLRRQVVPFVALSLIGLLLSTVAVASAGKIAADAGWSGRATALAAVTANVVAFGSVWVAQFFVLDRLLFRRRTVPVRRRG
jgi:putative flippase GtrA